MSLGFEFIDSEEDIIDESDDEYEEEPTKSIVDPIPTLVSRSTKQLPFSLVDAARFSPYRKIRFPLSEEFSSWFQGLISINQPLILKLEVQNYYPGDLNSHRFMGIFSINMLPCVHVLKFEALSFHEIPKILESLCTEDILFPDELIRHRQHFDLLEKYPSGLPQPSKKEPKNLEKQYSLFED